MEKEKQKLKEKDFSILIAILSVLTSIMLYPYFAIVSLITDKGISSQIKELDLNIQKLCNPKD